MSIASELAALNGYILGAYDEINTKGGTVPANKNMANLASAIASIGGGGGGEVDISGLFGLTKAVSGTFSVSSSSTQYYDLSHKLGILPKLVVFATDEAEKGDVRYIVGGFVLQTGTMLSSKLMSSGIHIGGGAVLGRTQDTSSFSVAGGWCNVATTGTYTSTVYDLYGNSSGKNGTIHLATSKYVRLVALWSTYNCYFAPNKTYHYLVAG